MFFLKDGDEFLESFDNLSIRYTRNPDQALAFDRQQEATIIARSLNRLASSGLKICAYKEVA